MSAPFDDRVVAAIATHMNDDHAADNVLIVRAQRPQWSVNSATLVDVDGNGGRWQVTLSDDSTTDIRVPWPNGPITERREVRREIVALYDHACHALGVTPRPHD